MDSGLRRDDEGKMEDLETRLSIIEHRNARVSLDKAWETSWTRRVFIAALTYICGAVLFLFVIPQPQWFLAALVPTMGYIVSTLSLPWLRMIWERKIK